MIGWCKSCGEKDLVSGISHFPVTCYKKDFLTRGSYQMEKKFSFLWIQVIQVSICLVSLTLRRICGFRQIYPRPLIKLTRSAEF